MIRLYSVILLLLILSCESNIDSLTFEEKLNSITLSDCDSIYSIGNEYLLHVPTSCFSTNDKVKIKYYIPQNKLDLLENRLLTETSNGEELVSEGMIYIKFVDLNGKIVFPKKTVQLYSKIIELDYGVKFFRGEKKQDNVVWNLKSQNDCQICEFKNQGSDSFMKEHGVYLTDQNIPLSTFLDSVYQESGLFYNDIYLRIKFSKPDKTKRKVILQGFDWLKGMKSDSIESLLRKRISDLSLGSNTSISYTYLKTASCNDFINNRFQFRIESSGWYNFDYILNSPKVSVLLVDASDKREYYLLSMDNKRVIKFPTSINGESNLSLSLRTNKEKFSLYCYDGEYRRLEDVCLINEENKCIILN